VFHPIQLASFAFMQFERGLEGLTEEEAQTRLAKADGTQTNAMSWITAHVAWQWIRLASRAAIALGEGLPGEDPYPELRRRSRQFRHTSDDPTPPSLAEALDLLHEASKANRWILSADDGLMNQIVWATTAPTARSLPSTKRSGQASSVTPCTPGTTPAKST
jgi:hypothetical protein